MPTDKKPNPLPAELQRALRRATSRSLAALTGLRRAVRDHVHQERDRGIDLDEIQRDLRAMIARAFEGNPAGAAAADDRAELTDRIMEWSAGFYSEKEANGE